MRQLDLRWKKKFYRIEHWSKSSRSSFDASSIEWLRPQEICRRLNLRQDPKMFVGKVDRFDINQVRPNDVIGRLDDFIIRLIDVIGMLDDVTARMDNVLGGL